MIYGNYTSHHPNCKHYDLEEEARRVIVNIIHGIDCWAADEDGVHDDCWEAYRDANLFLGNFDVLKRDIRP